MVAIFMITIWCFVRKMDDFLIKISADNFNEFGTSYIDTNERQHCDTHSIYILKSE